MRKLLCPTDFSACAQNAITYAAKLSHAIGAVMTLFHVQKTNAVLLGQTSSTKDITNALNEESAQIARTFKISCYAEVMESSEAVSKVIADKSSEFDLVVMGTQGEQGLMEFMGGSKTYQTIKNSDKPIILIPSDCLYSEIKNVVFSYNYLKERNLPIEQLVPFIKLLNAKLTILQVMEEARSKEMEEELKELQYILSTPYLNTLELKFETVRSDDAMTGIDSILRSNKFDLLALSSSNKNFITDLFAKNVVRKISNELISPVLVTHH